MFLVILTLFSLAGISLTSTIHKRGTGHNVPLINCPSCEHHICDIRNTIQCEVCHINVPHAGQPPQDIKCAQTGKCHSDNHHQFCCDTEACVASFFGHLDGSNTIPQHINPADSVAFCPRCHEDYCDFVHRDTCHMCKFDLHPGHVPHVHCLKGNEHCTENHNTICCIDESCIGRALGTFYPTTQSIHPTTAPKIHITDSLAHCPHCHGGYCDFVNRDTCYMCKFHLQNGHLPHVHCLKENEHCNDAHDIRCCKEESCIASAFGPYYPRTPSTYPTTVPTRRTTSNIHVTNQQTMYVSCPICSQGVCDPSRSYSFCTACVYHEDHKFTTCIKQGHEHACRDSNNQICCTTDECITKWFGVVVKTIDHGSTSPDSSIFCPHCDPNGQCHYSLCHICEYHLPHNSVPPQLKCVKQGHYCHIEDPHHICCRDSKCIEQAFGSNYWMIQTNAPPMHQVTTQPTTAISTTAVQTTPKLALVDCPLCRNGHCDFKNNTKCVVCRMSYDSKNATIMPITHCEITDNCANGTNVICCRTEQCIIGAYEPYLKTSNSSTTSPTTTIIPGHADGNTTNPISQKNSTGVTHKTQTTPLQTNTSSPSTIPFFHPSIGTNTTGTTTPLAMSGATSLVSSTTTVSTSTNIPNNCSDSISNCATLKGYGVCHAIPQQKEMYDIAFLHCRATCNLCKEIYNPLVASTTPPPPALHCQVCGDYDKDIPCDTRSIYIGPTVSCSGGNNYCMTDIVHSHSNVRVFKRCVNETICRNQWLSQTSDQDHCTNYGHVPVSGDYTCHFCCTSKQCNQGLVPDSSTLYSKS